MAIATDTTAGTIILTGDLQGSTDPYAPELTPTGVVPGTYTLASVVVDQKGRILYAVTDNIDIPCATDTYYGGVKPGDNITFDAGTHTIDVAVASGTTKGIVELGTGFKIQGGYLTLDLPPATTTTAGMVAVPAGGHIDIDVNGNISIPNATTSVLGVMEVGSGLAVSSGVVSVDQPSLSYPDATTSSKGFVQISDGLSISSGVVSTDTATINSNIADTTTSSKGLMEVGHGLVVTSGIVSVDNGALVFSDATTSSKGIVQIGSNIDVASGVISVPNATTSSKGVVQGSFSVDVTTGVMSITTIASAGTLGLIKVGAELGIDANGVLSRGQGDATTSSKGVVQIGSNIDVASGVISVPQATSSSKGVVQGSSSVDVTTGTASVTTVASGSTLGLVKVGSGLSVDGSGVLSITAYSTDATTSSKGIVQVGSNIDVASGVISVADATNTTKGVVTTADSTNLTFTTGSINVGTNVPVLNGNNLFSKAQVDQLNTLTYSTSITPDFSTSTVFELTLTGNTTINAPINGTNGGNYVLIIKQDATGGHTVTFNSSYVFASTPTITSTANAVDIVTCVQLNGTTYFSHLDQDFK